MFYLRDYALMQYTVDRIQFTVYSAWYIIHRIQCPISSNQNAENSDPESESGFLDLFGPFLCLCLLVGGESIGTGLE